MEMQVQGLKDKLSEADTNSRLWGQGGKQNMSSVIFVSILHIFVLWFVFCYFVLPLGGKAWCYEGCLPVTGLTASVI